MKIYHVADIHLGRRRLDGRLPDSDLADAFSFIADQAVQEGADALLIAGDLFDRPQVEPPHLRQAQRILARLKTANIPVIAIEGNHDKTFIHSNEPTWTHFLAQDDLLMLLRTVFNADGPIMAPWNSETRAGAYIDLAGIRFVGAGYLGAATPHKMQEIASRLEPDRTHVALLHAGPDYFVGEGGGFLPEDLRALSEKVCYLALGHIHKPMRHGDWACNPGSPENCELREAAYEWGSDGSPVPRGYAVLKIDPSHRHRPTSIEICSNPRRPCHRITLDCTPFGNKTKDGAAAFVSAATKMIREHKPARDAVIDLRLAGKLNLNRIALDHSAACAEIETAAEVYAVSLDATGLNVDGYAFSSGSGYSLSREDLEKKAIRELVDRKPLWGVEGHDADFAALFFELKEAVRAGKTGEELAELLNQSPLVELVRVSREATQPVLDTALLNEVTMEQPV
ncbi:MAG TPA: DNA repair exonuclease [Chthoniobacterales bacterium]